MTNVRAITDDAFEAEVLGADQPVLIDFWAEWCGPCKMIAPIFSEVAAEYAGNVQFMKMNVDDNTVIPTKYAVRGIPTLLLFKDGKVEATKVGALTKSQLIAFLDSHLVK